MTQTPEALTTEQFKQAIIDKVSIIISITHFM